MSRARWAVLGLLALAALAAVGCQGIKDLSQEFDPRGLPADRAYRAVIDPRVAEGTAYDGPATAFFAKALPLNWRVRQAMAEREAEAFALSPEQAHQRLGDQAAAYEKYNEVLLSLYVPEADWNDLAGRDATWKVYLDLGGQRLQPVDIRRIRHRTAINQALYPFWGPWSKLYRLRFPRAGQAEGAQGSLLVAGPIGQVELNLTVR